jgi:hypothetical protein
MKEIIMYQFRVPGLAALLAVAIVTPSAAGGLRGELDRALRSPYVSPSLTGALAIGSAVAGAIGQLAGVRPAMWVGAIVLALVWIPLLLSPIRRMRELPAAPEQDS